MAGNPTARRGSAPVQRFPLAVHASGRYLVDAQGKPFFLHGDTPWSLAVQFTQAQIETYLTTRRAQGFNAIMYNMIEHHFSSQSPAYRSVGGHDPFTSMTNFAARNEPYWQINDYIVNRAHDLGMGVVANPAYWGFAATDEGWDTEVDAESDADLQDYGAFLANRYSRGNVIWCMGGDANGTGSTQRDKQWNIITGIRSVRTTDIITAHPAPSAGDAYSQWSGYIGSGFNLNFVYDNGTETYTDSGTAYGRSGPIPAFLGETRYENEAGSTVADQRRLAWSAILSGCLAGDFFGNNPVWGGGEPNVNGGGGATAALAALSSAGATSMGHLKALLDRHDWHKLVPKTDTSLITTSLGSGTSRIVGALASDGTFALIYTPSANFTVAMTAFTPSSVRARWYDPATGIYAAASGSPFANSGTQAFTAPGESVLVLDGG